MIGLDEMPTSSYAIKMRFLVGIESPVCKERSPRLASVQLCISDWQDIYCPNAEYWEVGGGGKKRPRKGCVMIFVLTRVTHPHCALI